MKPTDLIRYALKMTEQGTTRLVEDMRNHALTQPDAGSDRAGNHTVWLLGHLCFIEGSIGHFIDGDTNPVEHWAKLFGTGTQPKPDAKIYPSFDELLTRYRELRAANLARLERIGDGGLDRAPAVVPPGFEDAMATVGQTLLLAALHNMVHYGQIADARRAAGRKSLM